MSSGQWEVVGKYKKDKTPATGTKKPGKIDKKTVVAAPKVEDVLPLSQVNSIYSNVGKSNKENKKPQEKEVNKVKEAKKPAKKADPPKPKPPKNIESALSLISVEDFKSCLEMSRQRFPDLPILWLKDLSAFLNHKLAVDLNDPVFSTKPDSYPFSCLPVGIKQIMERAVHDSSKPAVQLFYDITFMAMANDMSQGSHVIGHKIWLQFLAQTPQTYGTDMEKLRTLWTSYQNRQPIGLSILWALGQRGIKDFGAGLKAFTEFMLPILEVKNYSKFVVKYLSQLLKRHENALMSKDHFNFVLDFANSKHKLPVDAVPDFNSLNKRLRAIIFTKSNDKQVYFEPLLNKLSVSQSNSTKIDLCDMLFNCLQKDPNCYGVWKQLYQNTLVQSSILLKYICEHWKKISIVIDKKLFKHFLKTISVTNTDLLVKQNNNASLQESTRICKVLLDKMTAKSAFPWKCLVLVLLLAGGALLAADFNQNGSWKQTQSARTLKDIGVCEYVDKALSKAHQGYNWTRQRIEDYAPGYLEAAGGHLQPYVDLGRDLSLVAYNLGQKYVACAKDKAPLILETIEKYAPGFLEGAQNGWQQFVVVTQDYWSRGYQYVTTEVFVGQLAPENMQKVLSQTIDSTQKVAVDYYNWIYEKVQTSIQGK